MTQDDGASPLEVRYRRLLRVLPEPPRAVATGDTVRWVALLGALGAAAPAAYAQVALAPTAGMPWVPTWWTPVLAAAAVLTVVLFGCLVHGSWVARPVAGALLALQLVGALAPPVFPVLTAVTLLAVVVPLVAALLVEPVRAARPGRWWGAAAGVLVLLVGLPLLAFLGSTPLATLAAWALVLAGAGVVALRCGPPVAVPAVAVLGVATLPSLLVPLAGGPPGYVATQLGVAGALAAVTITCGVAGGRSLRGVPAAAG